MYFQKIIFCNSSRHLFLVKKGHSLCMQKRMSDIPNFFTQLMIQQCSEVSTVEPAVKLLKSSSDIAMFWAANLSYLVKITMHQRLSWQNTHLVPLTTMPLPQGPEKGINRNSKMQMTINNNKGGWRKIHQKCFCLKNARTFTLFTRNSSITIYEDEFK